MNLFSMILLNFLFLSYPLGFYIIYIIENKNIGKREKEMLFDFALLTSTFLIFHFQESFVAFLLPSFLSVLLFLAIYQNRFLVIFLLELFLFSFLETSHFLWGLLFFSILNLLWIQKKEKQISFLVFSFGLFHFLWQCLLESQNLFLSFLLTFLFSNVFYFHYG